MNILNMTKIMNSVISKWIFSILSLIMLSFSGYVLAQAKTALKTEVGGQISDSLRTERKRIDEKLDSISTGLNNNMLALFMRNQKAMELSLPGYKDALDSIDRDSESTEKDIEKMKRILKNGDSR